MERAEKIGLGIASAGHVLLFAALSTSWLSVDPLKLRNSPIEVSIADEAAFESTARKLAPEPPSPAAGVIEAPPERAVQETAQSVSKPPPQPIPTPAPPEPAQEPHPQVRPKDVPKTAPAKPAPVKDTSAPSRGMLKLDTRDWSKSESRAAAKSDANDGTLAASMSAIQKSALDAEIRRQLKPHWKAPAGADAELLRTIVTVKLARDGSIVGEPEIVDTLGVTASNRAQVRLHQEQAIRAIRLAAPFNLPPDLYSGWNFLRLTFDKRLSQ